MLVYHTSHELAERTPLTGFLSDILVGAAGVDLFFVISGFVMVYASEAIFAQPGASRYFLARRLARIVPLYWATTLFFFSICGRRTARCRPTSSRTASGPRSSSCPGRAPTASWARCMRLAGR